MKKLLLTLEYPPHHGGVAVYLKNLVDQFDPNNICVLAPRTKNSFVFDLKQPYVIHRLNLLSRYIWPRWLRTYVIAKRLCFREKIDQVIISHILPMGYVALLLNRPYTLIVHGQDILMAKTTPWKNFWMKKILNGATNIIANSKYTQDLILAEGVANPDKLVFEKSEEPKYICVSYPCPKNFNLELDLERLNYWKHRLMLNGKFTLLSVNRLVSRKGNDKVIETLGALKEHLPDFRYIIVGNGVYQSKLENLIDKYDLGLNVTILNEISDEDLPYLYEACDVFIMPSRLNDLYDVEGFGIVYLEAALFHKPSIAGNVGGAPEAVIDHQTGLLVNPNSIDEIGKAIMTLMLSEQLRLELGDRAYARAAKDFTWSNSFMNVTEILK